MKIKQSKTTYACSLILLLVFLVAALSLNVSFVAAQDDVATVIVMPTTGGTTNPAPGQYTYENGTNIELTAMPDAGYQFLYWIASGDLTPGHTTREPIQLIDPETGEVVGVFPDFSAPSPIDTLAFTANPTSITCGYGYTYTYTAVFAPISGGATETEATIIVMPTTGGTVSPAPGVHTYANSTTIELMATASPGYEFKYWIASGNQTPGHGAAGLTIIADPDTGEVIAQFPRPDLSGIDTLTFTNNPVDITCGYGYTYTYTAVFESVETTPAPTATSTPISTPSATATPAATASPQPTSTPITAAENDNTIWIIVAVVIIIIVVALIAVIMRRKK